MSPTAEKYGFSSQRDQACAQGRTKAGGFGHAMEHTACCFQPSLGRVFSLSASLLPRKALGLSSAEPLDAAGFKLPGTAELLLTVLPTGRAESF